jgi:hypothetical protein
MNYLADIDINRIAEGAFWLIVVFLYLAYTSDSWPFNKRD